MNTVSLPDSSNPNKPSVHFTAAQSTQQKLCPKFSTMKLDFTTLGVFTTTRYQGNPVAIIRVPEASKVSLTQVQKQAIASEYGLSYSPFPTGNENADCRFRFNLSEIVFLYLPAEGESFREIDIDIFTSQAEVPFAVCSPKK